VGGQGGKLSESRANTRSGQGGQGGQGGQAIKKVWEQVTQFYVIHSGFSSQTFISTLTALTALTKPVFMRVSEGW
jgi:hypothetical protein